MNNKINLWVELYMMMQQSHKEAKGIIMINQFEKYKNMKLGSLNIPLSAYHKHDIYGVNPIMSNIIVNIDDYTAQYIEIKILNKEYELIYVVYDYDTEENIRLISMINENEVARILTLIIYDYYTISSDIDIYNNKYKTLMNKQVSKYKKGIWDIINWQNNL